MQKVLSSDYVNQIRKIWSECGASSTSNTINESIYHLNKVRDIYDTLTIGESFIFIINHKSGTFDYVSPKSESILGYKSDEYTVELSLNLVHPEDLDYVISIHQQIYNINNNIIPQNRTNYKFNYDFRMRDSKGTIKQIHVQHFFLEHNKDFLPINFLCVMTDISQLKIGGIPTLSLFNIKNGLNNILNQKNDHIILTNKEKEIADYLIKGYTSQDIGEVLNISKHTVDTHRRNILKKNNCSNTTEFFSLFLEKKIASL
ncbi:PAS fold-containing protein [Chishuiella changwenlii]|uniref:PAS fold-containing protein n=1 Tax=Chishuiella changwenlii TaxID=1434701 RepID=A0A1M6W6A9_9FLAO|nr:hypothetical protein GCM10010984_03150 [Chishuiella changwenlii]SHK89169.1 PAS fold-containing protein [Chishuiella changwenlii]